MDSGIELIVNKDAGGMADEKARQNLMRLIEQAFEGAAIVFTDGGADIFRLARRAVGRGTGIVIAGGGDGTTSAAASVLAGTDAALGVLPLGTLNHFAKDLGIPSDLQSAIQALATGLVNRVDVGEVNGRLFVNNSSLGLYPEIVRLREARQAKGKTKWRAALWAALKALMRYQLLTIRVIVKGKEFIRTTPIVFVGNNRYSMEGLNIGTRSRLDAGELSLYISHARGRLGLLWFSLRALLGLKSCNLDVILTEEVRIESRHRRVQVSLDGEVMTMDTPLHYRIRPKALKVIVPLPGQ